MSMMLLDLIAEKDIRKRVLKITIIKSLKQYNMEKLPTAEEFYIEQGFVNPKDSIIKGEKVIELMIEFAKLHVTAALKEANEEALKFVDAVENGDYKPQIINSYPLTNIK